MMASAVDWMGEMLYWLIPVHWHFLRDMLQTHTIQRGILAILLLAPVCAIVGVQVVNLRMAFFAESIGHSAFTGIGLGFALASFQLLPSWLSPTQMMLLFGVIMGLAITFYRQRSDQATDTIVGVFSSAVIAFGLCLLDFLTKTGRLAGGRDQLLSFIMGDILSLSSADVAFMIQLYAVVMVFEIVAYNRLLFIGLNPTLAQTLGIHVNLYLYSFAALVAVVVMTSIQAVGVLIVTAMLIIPAAAARSLAWNAGSVFWLGLLVAWSSAGSGILISLYLDIPTGATVVLCATIWYLLGHTLALIRGRFH